jgi:hypothetical protein
MCECATRSAARVPSSTGLSEPVAKGVMVKGMRDAATILYGNTLDERFPGHREMDEDTFHQSSDSSHGSATDLEPVLDRSSCRRCALLSISPHGL